MRLAIVGLGKLGAPMAAVAASNLHTVVGVDADSRTVAAINQRIAPVQETGLQELISSLPAGQLTATTSIREAVEVSDVVIVMVPTPSLPSGAFDPTLVVNVATAIARSVHHFTTVVVGSTVSPGTTNGVVKTALQSTGLRVGHTCGLVYSPEFIALGSVIRDLRHPDMILVGADDPLSRTLYADLVAGPVLPTHLTIVEAEIAKLALNCYITTKISFANMIADVCTAYNANPHQVLHAIGKDSRIGNKYFKAGGPFGGPCFPRDGSAMIAAAHAVNRKALIVDATVSVNTDVITSIFREAVPFKSIAILGMTYKTETHVTEQSLGTRLLAMFTEWPFPRHVYTHDPQLNGGDPQGFVRAVDCVILATQWPEYTQLDYSGKHVIDPWGLLCQR